MDTLDKEVLYDLLQKYLLDELDTEAFCDQFTLVFSRQIEYSSLSTDEYDAFSALDDVADRFTPYLADLARHKGVFYDAVEVRKKATETYDRLKSSWPGDAETMNP